MNFQDLLATMKRLDEEDMVPADGTVASEPPVETSVEECGMDMMPMGRMPAPKQTDSVTMNVSMNGSGAGGIRDLLNVLKDIQDGSEHDVPHDDDDTHDILIGEPEESYEEESINDGGFGTSTTNPDETTLNINSIFPRGSDMHSNQGDHRPRQAGLPMGNPQVQEGLVKQLTRHYESIKGESLNEFDVKLYQPASAEFNRGFGANISQSPEVKAIIAQMKPTDYIETSAFQQQYPKPTDYKEHNSWSNVLKGHQHNDMYNFVQRYNRDNNNLSVAQWLEKAKNSIKGAVTGQPAQPVSYQANRYDQQNPANNNRLGGSKQQDEKSFPIKESTDIVALSKMLNR